MGSIKRYLFENRNFDPDYDPEADHTYDFEGEEGVHVATEEPEQNEDDEDEEEVEAPPPPTFNEEEVLAAQQTAFDEGKTAGLQEANAQFEHLIATALTQISQNIPDVFQSHSQTQEDHESHALSVATAVVKKIIPAYAEKNGLDEIVHVVSQCLEPLRAEPRIIVKVHESLRDDVHDKLTVIADQIGFDGRVVVMAQEDIVPGDCRVEWSEGGAERNSDDLWQLIDEIIERNLTQGANSGENQPTADTHGEAPVDGPLDTQAGLEETS
ncbi:FlbE protein (modular protein) [Candidatus Terasakiella magnetica]|uniref:FlbE protein (Modular protein) n=1 Tax=Candidatus Terasakiella magnetica TaxID=1867952 RepID=A0A1C3RKX6_9PROT|nr:FliH/SctL family protein [Candidatus Terasakiella magnetica]SCA57829.1 FlbE protein (modular protein) [Candidatus Terasakiella magnetica]